MQAISRFADQTSRVSLKAIVALNLLLLAGFVASLLAITV